MSATQPAASERDGTREPLREHVRRMLVERMLTGELEPGARIKESVLAEELEISRTPLREALVKLESERLVTSSPGKGATVAALDPETGAELYELVAWFETSALLRSPIPDDDVLDELARLDELRAEAEGIHRGIELDTAWHDTLIARCENQQLAETVGQLRLRLYRYVYWTHTSNEQRAASVAQHQIMRSALADGDLARATQHLREHWEHGRRELKKNADFLAERFAEYD